LHFQQKFGGALRVLMHSRFQQLRAAMSMMTAMVTMMWGRRLSYLQRPVTFAFSSLAFFPLGTTLCGVS